MENLLKFSAFPSINESKTGSNLRIFFWFNVLALRNAVNLNKHSTLLNSLEQLFSTKDIVTVNCIASGISEVIYLSYLAYAICYRTQNKMWIPWLKPLNISLVNYELTIYFQPALHRLLDLTNKISPRVQSRIKVQNCICGVNKDIETRLKLCF